MRERQDKEQGNRQERELALEGSNEGGVGFSLWPEHHRVNNLRQKGNLGMSLGVLEKKKSTQRIKASYSKLNGTDRDLPHPPCPPAAKQYVRDEREGGRWTNAAVLLLSPPKKMHCFTVLMFWHCRMYKATSTFNSTSLGMVQVISLSS